MKEVSYVRGLVVFFVFFVIFLVSSFIIPHPLFPGSFVCLVFGISSNISFISAGVNGLFYGFVVWVVFRLGFRWVEGLGSGSSERKKG